MVELLAALQVVDVDEGWALAARLDRVQAMLWQAIGSVSG